jgi:hypothetical protein
MLFSFYFIVVLVYLKLKNPLSKCLYRIEGKPEDVLNPKKKQLEKITPVCVFCPLLGSRLKQTEDASTVFALLYVNIQSHEDFG